MTDQEWINRWLRESDPEQQIGQTHAFARAMLEFAILVVACIVLIVLASQANGQTVSNSLASLNANRAARGLYPLASAGDLQIQAEREAVIRAQRGISGHLPGGAAPGRAEGVGVRSGSDHWGQRFLTCFMDTRKYRYAGAATAVNRRGRSFYVLLLR